MSCAKRFVMATVVTPEGQYFVGTNDCADPQPVCPREPGEGYEKCTTVCRQWGHAEVVALKSARGRTVGAHLYIVGHDHACESCVYLARLAGIEQIHIIEGT